MLQVFAVVALLESFFWKMQVLKSVSGRIKIEGKVSIQQTERVTVCHMATSTHQLELRSPFVGLLYAVVCPQSAQCHHIQLKLTGLDPRAADSPLPRHHQHALLLVLAALPADTQLVPRVHQYTHALQEEHTKPEHMSMSVEQLWGGCFSFSNIHKPHRGKENLTLHVLLPGNNVNTSQQHWHTHVSDGG